MNLYWIITFGCQMNVYDSEKLAGLLTEMGYKPASEEAGADIILLNTCTVREKAAQKVYTKLGRIKKYKTKKPHLIIGVCGCLAQQEGHRLFRRAPYINLVLGSRAVAKLPLLLESVLRTGEKVINLAHLDESTNFKPNCIKRNSPFQAYITIMEGCNNFCSYCIVPYVRGREVYRQAAHILEEISILANKGYKEITLLGQNVNSYHDPFDGKTDFARLLQQVDSMAGIQRIRFITSHPKDFSFQLVQTIKEREKICPHIHLPLQSGSNRILQLMNRKYNQKQYMEKVSWLKNNLTPLSITTDIIVGFPSETREDFQQTMKVVKEIEFDGIFSFKYCPRPHTAAFKLEDSVAEKDKSNRLMQLQALQKSIQIKKNKEMIGQIVEVLVEGFSQKYKTELMARTVTNKIVNFPAKPELIGKFVKIKITDAGPNSLIGEICLNA